jgi:hypothetical protein
MILNDNRTGKSVDTDKIPDIEAMIIEKAEEFRLMCIKTGCQCLVLVDPQGKMDGQSLCFWSTLTKAGETEDLNEKRRRFINLINMIQAFVLKFSMARFRVFATPSYEELFPPKKEF